MVSHTPDITSTTRRNVLKWLGLTTATAATGTTFAGSAAAVDSQPDEGGEPVLYQYFHTEWGEIESDLDRLAEIGVDGIWVPQPAVGKLDWEDQTTEDQEGFYGEEHPYFGTLEPHPPLGYQPVDLEDFDSPHGSEWELESMIDTAHDHDIDVIVDVVLNHMSTNNGPDGEVSLPQFDRDEHFHDYGTIGDDCELDGDEETYECDLLGLPTLDIGNDHVQSVHVDYLERIADLGADGLRIDAAGHVWPWYFEYEINPLADDLDLWRVGEIWDGDLDTVMEFADTGMNVFDFPLFYAMEDAFENGDMTALDADDAPGVVHNNPWAAVTFAQNHDVSGPGVGPDDPEGIEMDLAHAYLLSYAGVPMLFFTKEGGSDIDDPELQDLIWVKRNLATGEPIDRYIDEDLYIYEREENLLAGLNNNSWEDRSEWVETSWVNETLVDYTGNGGNVTTNDDGWVEISVPSESWVMYAPDGQGGPDDGDDDDSDDGNGEVTFSVDVDVDYGESVYFTGDTDELTNWGGGVEGTHSDGSWELTIDDPGTFEWKTRLGPSGGSGEEWEQGDNHDQDDLSPTHQGWE